MNYITLTQVRQQLNLRTGTSDNDIFNNWINWSCGLIDYWKGRRFDVYYQTILLDTPILKSNMIGSFAQLETIIPPTERIYLNVSEYDLLEIVELKNGDESVIASNKYITEPTNKEYINRILLRKSSGLNWLPNDDGEYEQVISLKGIFGFNSNYSKCFVDTKLVLNGAMTTETLSITLGDISNPAKDGLEPAIQVGMMLKIDDEFMLVEEIDEDDYSVNIALQRQFNGSELTEHENGSTIYVYRPDAQIVQMALRLVQWRYRQKDQDNFDRTFNFATQTASTPTSIPADVRAILGKRRMTI